MKYKLYDFSVILKLVKGNFKDNSVNLIRTGKPKKETQERLKRRAKSRVMEYALCNEWQYFFTQTISSARDRYDKENIKKIRRTLSDAGIKYLLCIDRHKDGALHLHGLLKNVEKEKIRDSGVKALNKQTNEKQSVYNLKLTEKYGFNSLFEITANNPEQRVKIANYVSAYITKDNNREFKQRYFVSEGLNKKQEIYISNEYLNDYIAKNGLLPDYKNDYVDIYILPPYELDYISEKEKNQSQIITELRSIFGNLVKVEE
jgi:hypothetical protein